MNQMIAQISPSVSSRRLFAPPRDHSNSKRQDLMMAGRSEILFVDPAVPDLETILGNLRPEVHSIVLDGRRPAARQIAAALEGRERLEAVHVMAHGAPGRVRFASGEWSAETVSEAADDFAAIG